ncbi:MAG: DNA alkylation repair protein [Firmicutes bacterium]|nr:DNA alkylation repair protein [Bacillota bacterium]
MLDLPTIWTKETYQEYINYLISIKEDKYKEFHSKLCFTKYEILGIRLPIIRKIAKQISKTNYEDFLKLTKSKYYEEVLIEGLVISTIKDESIFDKYFNKYISKIDNWGICDSFCNSLNIVTKNPIKYFNLCKELSLSNEEFISRVGLIIILNYFIKQEYLKDIFNILDSITSDKYYINMAQAWLICELYIYYSQETEKYLKNNKLNNFTHNKSISKIRESYRISKEEKDYLNTLKRK